MADSLGKAQAQDMSTSTITIVRIKRRRDDPVEPEIILEAAGLQKKKQARYDEVLLQMQGLSFVGGTSAHAPEAPRRRFRRLQTVELSVLEAMSENDVLRMLRSQSGVSGSTNTPPPATATAGAPPTEAVTAAVTGTATSAAPIPAAEGLSGSAAAPVVAAFPPQQSGAGAPLGGTMSGSSSLPGPEGLRSRSVKGSLYPHLMGKGPPGSSQLAVRRSSHRQAGAAARFKQIRRKREEMFSVGEGPEGDTATTPAASGQGLLHVYDLERLPGTAPTTATTGATTRGTAAGGGGRREPRRQRPYPPGPQRQQQVQGPQVSTRQHQLQQQAAAGKPQQQPAGTETAGAPSPGGGGGSALPDPSTRAPQAPDEAVILQQYGPLIDEYLRSVGAQQPSPVTVRRIPARARKAATASATSPAPIAQPSAGPILSPHQPPGPTPSPPQPQQPQPQQHVLQPQGVVQQQQGSVQTPPPNPRATDTHAPKASPLAASMPSHPGASATTAGDALPTDESIAMAVEDTTSGAPFADPKGSVGATDDVMMDSTHGAVGDGGNDGDVDGGYVYDVYVAVHEGAEDGEEEDVFAWPWVGAPSGSDLTVPVIEVGEEDDEFFWAGQMEVEPEGVGEDHDSEDSNAESFYANSYPDEEDAPYEGASGGEEGDEEDLAEPDAVGYGWGGVVSGGKGRRGALSDDDDNDEGGEEDDKEIYGRRRSRVVKKYPSYYRTEDDDYSEHSSFLSEEEERREAEERRNRAIFMH